MIRHIACLALVVALSAPCLADDPPDSEVNPQSGFIETVTTVWNGANHHVRLTIDRGALPPLSAEIATGSTDDLGPRIAITASGKVSVVWTRDGSIGQVYARARTSSGWGSNRLVSDPTENSRNPEIVQDGSVSRVVYEIQGASSSSIAVSIIGDEPDPITTRTIVATTSWSGDIDSRIQAETGHVWVTWIHDGSEVGWSELNGSGAWTSVAYHGYAGSDTDAARALIREIVLGF